MALKALDYDSLNENVKQCQYAIRGELYLRASERRQQDYFHKRWEPSCFRTEAADISSPGGCA